jgi:hypothetical protein
MMDNKQLELEIKEILATTNFFDMVEKALAFEKTYKASSFYKATKMPLMEVIKQSKMWYLFDLDSTVKKIQNHINELDLSKLLEIINEAGEMFATQNQEIFDMIQEVKDITL